MMSLVIGTNSIGLRLINPLGFNSKQWQDVRKKMIDTEKELGRIQSGVANVTQVMQRLDKATPNELKKVLKQLKSELDNRER